MFFLLILDSKDAFDLSLLETNLTECYLRSSGSSLPRSLSAKAPESWSALCPPSLDTNKCPSSDQWIQSFAFIGDTNPVFLSSTRLHIALWREVIQKSGLIWNVFFTCDKCCCGLCCNQSTLPIKHPMFWCPPVITRRDRVTFSIWNFHLKLKFENPTDIPINV